MMQESMQTTETCATVSGVTMRFPGGTMALPILNFDIHKGEIFCLLGPNGAGKTTLVRLLTGQLKPTSGHIRVFGHDPYTERDLVTQRICLVTQEIALYDELTGRENLAFHAALFNVETNQVDSRIDAMLAVAGLTDRQKDRVKVYSGGMKRRLQLARGMLHDPDILFLDEPTLGVDVQSRNAIHEYIKQVPKTGKTVVLTTNYMEEAQKLADRIVVLDSRMVAGPDTIEGITRTTIPETMLDFTVKEATVPEGFRDQFLRDTLSGEIVREEPISEGIKFRVKVPDTRVESILDSLLTFCHGQAIEIQGLAVSTPTIEDAFLQLTGKGLRD